MKIAHDVIFLFDCDNTLLDNDQVQEDISTKLAREFGTEGRDRYWQIYETLRTEFGYTDYLGALQRFRLSEMNDPRLLMLSEFLLEYPFTDRLYPDAINVIHHLQKWGSTVILSDGDAVFQPRKIQRSGLWDAVEGRVLIYIHKESMLNDIAKLYPAHHYVMVDDKLRILDAMKNIWQERLTTIFPRQGHYAFDPLNLSAYQLADLTIEHIGDLLNYNFSSQFKFVMSSNEK